MSILLDERAVRATRQSDFTGDVIIMFPGASDFIGDVNTMFIGTLINVNIEFQTNLVPYPRIHFMLFGYAPIIPTE